MSVTASTAHPATMTATRQRWRFVDALRGFAVFGILLVNAVDITEVGYARMEETDNYATGPLQEVLNLTVQTRFVPIFILLFGMSLWIVLDGARARSSRPGLVMVRRLVGLSVIGWALMLAYPGNILLEYGVVGLLMLPVILFAPRWLTFWVGAAGTVAAYAIFGGGLPSVPGLILLGAGAAAYGLPRILETSTKPVAIVFAVAAVLTPPALLWQMNDPMGGDPRFSTAGATAGLVMAVLYTTGLALLWRTPARTVLSAVFEPLGRMALSNYVGAAVVVAVAAQLIDFGHMASIAPVLLMAVGIIAAQSILSRLWLKHFVYGPIEWLWRTATWLRPVAFRRTA